ncbi:variable surface protein [Plasmodium gonderi]|uniref:Variable surface protein n=1 Tax=Plasmodium gonderi TaxID=77519 RepID=A0A1Y1JNF0_PLAGO|nr:variable surface protein [Plasmodium gonderi]GAW84116.1 variable surface protein [Plasmodium gonderi]
MDAFVSTETYFNYEDYISYKGEFSISPAESLSTHDIEEFLQDFKDVDAAKTTIQSFCMKIKAYFEYINHIYSSSYNKCCDYINYYIKELDDMTYISTNETLSMYLRAFVNNYNYDANNMKFRCNLKDIDGIIYEKKKKLYNIYDIYSSIFQIRANEIPGQDLCYYFQSLIEAYSELLNIIKSPFDSAFLAEVNNISCLIEKNELKSNVKCSRELLELSEKINSGYYEKKCIVIESPEQMKEQLMHSKINFVETFSTNNSPKKVIITTVLFTINLGAIFLYLYQYREFWKILRLRMLRKIRRTMNMKDEQCEHRLFKYEIDLTGTDEKNYNITYTSGI